MSKGVPADPSSDTIRPQYGSSPKSEHCTSMESATLRAARWAAVSLSAPLTRTWATLVAPSASATICSASERQASVSARVSSAGDGDAPSPLARTSTVSLVDVDPSTVIVLNEAATASVRALCNVGASTAASVVQSASIVAMLGASMAAPLAMPPTVKPSPATTTSFGTVSVVMMARAAWAASCRRGAACHDDRLQLRQDVIDGERDADKTRLAYQDLLGGGPDFAGDRDAEPLGRGARPARPWRRSRCPT